MTLPISLLQTTDNTSDASRLGDCSRQFVPLKHIRLTVLTAWGVAAWRRKCTRQ